MLINDKIFVRSSIVAKYIHAYINFFSADQVFMKHIIRPRINENIAKKLLSECMENITVKDGCSIKGLIFSGRNL